MPDLTLREMTAQEFDEWRGAEVRGYADAQVTAGVWGPGEALRRSAELHDSLLPAGLATPGMVFLRGVRPDGAVIGTLWIALEHPRGVADCAFLFDIEVVEEHRSAGYGRALLTAAESFVRERGIGALELNVHGDNARAMKLYASSGYRVITQQMRKDLGSGSADHEG
ncbi:GNAT family N-acetyltransferase [Actinoplanes oblitus]|uniref:GNAT family N-acetyltransferase n=1 Tax=Actinoplanes oblitus TaxID=3040509 RepID=A0ABY8WGW9_9ACTN|nr:GNAT family N-acetyltransferase [Actinoplanes oblitus]WIM96727.1 GNAT family N-acetyltransferase [Actinoplanes oblitus]